MPNLIVPIPATHESVTRRVANCAVQRIMEITGIPKSYPIRYYGEVGVNHQPGSTVDQPTDDPNTYKHTGKITVSVAETYNENRVINSPVRYPDAQPIFQDQSLGVHVKPIYSYTEMELSVQFRAATKQEVQIWRDDIKVRMADNREQHLLELDYHYPVPGFCVALLHHVHGLRETVAGYGETLSQYLRAHFTDRATVLSTPDGDVSKSLLVIGEKQIGVQGYWDFVEPEEAEKNEDGPSWTATFTYRLSYEKPVSTNVIYPLMIHNQMIDPRFYSTEPVYDPYRLPSLKGEIKFHLDRIDFQSNQPSDPVGGTRLPEFDEWIPDTVPNYTTSMITWMLQLLPEDRQSVITEPEILGMGFMPEVLLYMQAAGAAMAKRGHSMFHAQLFQGTLPMDDSWLTVIPTAQALEFRSTQPLELRNAYHLRLSFVTEYSLLTDTALALMQQFGMATLRAFQTVVNDLDVEYAQANYMSDKGVLSLVYIEWFYRYLRNHRVGYYGPGETIRDSHEGWPLVQYLTIIAKTRKDA